MCNCKDSFYTLLHNGLDNSSNPGIDYGALSGKTLGYCRLLAINFFFRVVGTFRAIYNPLVDIDDRSHFCPVLVAVAMLGLKYFVHHSSYYLHTNVI